MKRLKKLLNEIFIDGLSGMASGLFATLIIGTIIQQIGHFVPGMAGIYAGRLVSGKTKVDILVTPFACIVAGASAGLVFGPPVSAFMTWLGAVINWGTVQAPFLMGIIVSVLMGMILTLPVSSAALGIILGLNGIAAGAAAAGCCANMVGFAAASFRENKVNGLLAQGLGTSMLQIGNIVKKPVIWLPAIITSAVLGPVSTMVFGMVNNPAGSGMGTAGLVGQINAYQTMTEGGMAPGMAVFQIVLMHFVLPGILALLISEWMRKKQWIREGDMKLDI